jgi:hypothetical protein
MSMKKSNDTIGKQTRDLPTCSAVPQSSALPPKFKYCNKGKHFEFCRQVLIVVPNIKFHENLSSRKRTDACGKGDDTDVKGDFGVYAQVPEIKKFSLCTIPRYRGREAATRFIINRSTVWILHPAALPPGGKKPLRRNLGGPQGQSGRI